MEWWEIILLVIGNIAILVCFLILPYVGEAEKRGVIGK